LANLYYDNGEYEKAAAAYQESLNLHPQDPGVETDLATCYYNLGQEDKALEILDRVLKYRPGFSQAMFNKGIVLISGKKDIKGGIAIWEELLRLDPVFAQKAELEQKIHQLKASVK
jgi:tetratricopeptide (TPR) repeat protein